MLYMERKQTALISGKVTAQLIFVFLYAHACARITYDAFSHILRKQTFAYPKTRRNNCEVDQRLSFRYMDSTISLLLKSEISSV